LDDEYPPTWILLGDTYAAMNQVDEALKAHGQAMQVSDDFFDQFVDQRLNFYISAGRLDDIVATMEQAAKSRAAGSSPIPWAIGHAYNLAGQPEKAIVYLEQAQSLGDNSDRVIRELARSYMNQNSYDRAVSMYEFLLQASPNDVEAHSALAFIYAQQNRPDEAIQHNQQVLQQRPNDYDSLKNLAILYQQKEQWQEALQAAQQAQAVAPPAEAQSWDQFIDDLETRIDAAG
jgi:tetratricopeptide (TPR) repeat protein